MNGKHQKSDSLTLPTYPPTHTLLLVTVDPTEALSTAAIVVCLKVLEMRRQGILLVHTVTHSATMLHGCWYTSSLKPRLSDQSCETKSGMESLGLRLVHGATLMCAVVHSATLMCAVVHSATLMCAWYTVLCTLMCAGIQDLKQGEGNRSTL